MLVHIYISFVYLVLCWEMIDKELGVRKSYHTQR
jgi:hypothetical protein